MRAELARDDLEKLERIEQALSERIVHNPKWLDETKYDRELAMQRYEASALIKMYRDTARQIDLNALEPVKVPTVDEFLELVSKIPESGPAADLRAVYVRHDKARGLSRFKCDLTADLNVDRLFTIPESYGRYLDLTPLHQLFLNIPDAPQVTYKEYVEKIADFDDILYIPVTGRQKFSEYLSELQKYLETFYRKTHLLGPPLKIEQPVNTSPLYCAICEKEFASEGVFKAHFTGKKHKRAAGESKSAAGSASGPGQIMQLCKSLQPQLAATRANLVRLAGMTRQERQIENQVRLDELDFQDNYVSDSEDAETEVESTAPNGHIPGWLAKINGLHLQFPCEVCGGAVYHGPKAFERHFSESRHLHGLKCLGVTNASAYAGITKISEVLNLQKKLSKMRRIDAEMEDEDGNVMTTRVYQDLQRQGLL